MLKSLRRVEFPEDLQTHGPLIKAVLIHHVKCHTEMMDQAKKSAAFLLQQAEQEATQIRTSVQAQVAASLKADVESLRTCTEKKEQALYERSSELCTEVCAAVFQQVVQDLPSREKIRSLVQVLLNTAHHGRSLQLCCHPDQVELVEQEVGKIMAEQMNIRQWNVKDSHELQPFEILISTPNGAEIQVSLDNLLAIYKEEIAALRTELDMLVQTAEAKP